MDLIEEVLENLKWTIKLFSLTLIIPIVGSLFLVFAGILGMDLKFGFLMSFKVLWIDYYFTGSIFDIDAWRWHLGFLFLCLLISIFGD